MLLHPLAQRQNDVQRHFVIDLHTNLTTLKFLVVCRLMSQWKSQSKMVAVIFILRVQTQYFIVLLFFNHFLQNCISITQYYVILLRHASNTGLFLTHPTFFMPHPSRQPTAPNIHKQCVTMLKVTSALTWRYVRRDACRFSFN